MTLKSKNAYNKTEMIEFIKQVEQKFLEMDQLVFYEVRNAYLEIISDDNKDLIG